MITLLYLGFLVLLAIIGAYHWFYMHEVRKTERQIGFMVSGAVHTLLSISNVLVVSCAAFIVATLFFNFMFGI